MKLIVKNISKIYKNKNIVKEISLDIKQGEIVGLLGPNGAGKTTSFNMIAGLIKVSSGKIFIDNEDITLYPMYKRAKKGIGYLPQESSIFRKLSVEDNILSILEMTSLSKGEQKKKLDSIIKEFNLKKIKNNIGNILSGGEKRRTEIARSIVINPKFLLLDEPFSGIDPISIEDIQKIIIKLKLKNIGILITDHNVKETLSITDRSYLLFEGKIFKYGTTKELINDKIVKKIYLGNNFFL